MFLSVDIMDNLPGTDHDAFQFKLACDYSIPHCCQRLLYNYKKTDFAYFSDLLNHVPWHLIDYTDDIESSWNMWKDVFFAAVDATIPKIKWKKHK